VKVLMLSHMYPGPVNPTAGIFVHEQVRALIAQGHDVRVVSPTPMAPPLLPRYRVHRRVPAGDRVDGIPVLRPRKLSLPGGRLAHLNPQAMLWSIGGPLRRVHKRWPFEVVHAHMLVPDGWAAACVGAELGVPVVATAHRADVLDIPARGERSRAVVAQAVDAVEQIVTVSRAIRAACESVGWPRRPVEVVPNGADTAVFHPRDARAARVRLGVPEDGAVISYVGKLVPRKGVDTLIEALGILRERPGGAPWLVAAGVGEMQPALEKRARELGVDDRVRFLGKLGREDVAWAMAAGDLFVLPSLSEGLPTVVCEAMACGLPTVATAVDGTPEIVDHGETGLLVPPRDARALADAMARLLDDPAEARAMGDRALARARETYTWAANAARMGRLYAAVAA
jgi:glycosyltransferase involved in cell wall biosynthesis